MSGGFIPPPHTPTSSAPNGHPTNNEDVKPEIQPEPLLRLTTRQEGRLRTHLDGRLTDLERDSKTHGFGTLQSLLQRLQPILRLILQIPPIEPWSSLRISYLLAFTGSLIDYITSLPLVPSHPSLDDGDQDTNTEGTDSRGEQAGQVMRHTIDFMNEVDRAWRLVLKGNAFVMEGTGNTGRAVRVDYAGTVGQTERIRLRSIVMTGRAKVLAWARSYGSFPGATFGGDGTHTPKRAQSAETGDWETEVMGMWNGILDTLSRTDSHEDEDIDTLDPDEV